MKPIFRRWFQKGKARIARRLDQTRNPLSPEPVLKARNIHYEVSDKAQAIHCGGIGLIHALGQRFGLAKTIDQKLHLLKFHVPYHESDHVLTLAYNPLCGGTCFKTSNSSATTRPSSTPWTRDASPTPPPPATSAAASWRPTSKR
ncbi:hypothetical protein FRUB_03882 [Fimbriiglobus ruber]|uniref:Uncharacterized protein n=1 Tax=Fimbriiglobus ruber TaxID=1908690 RepID=A0A225DQA6_9BACT|nr:hypothetical protein [Fimbriiglobus ruber]OWK41804.1 hypothetical protein FRUB_03882 [Fimbriiglobus ruber]